MRKHVVWYAVLVAVNMPLTAIAFYFFFCNLLGARYPLVDEACWVILTPLKTAQVLGAPEWVAWVLLVANPFINAALWLAAWRGFGWLFRGGPQIEREPPPAPRNPWA